MPSTNSHMTKRKKIIRLLDSLSGERIIYVCAPAGYGKTVAVREWLAWKDESGSFVSLDEFDNEPVPFCRRFCEALRGCQPENSELIRIISHPTFDNAPEEFTVRAISALATEGSSLFVIDDLHFISNERTLRLLTIFLKRLPERFQIVLISRNELPSCFSQLWLGGKLARVTAGDLRFNLEEITQLYSERGHHITHQKADEILRFTDGWAIGISALLLSDGDPKGDVTRHLDEFIHDNVWSRWDEATRGFIMKTSVIGELTPPICAALTGQADCEAILDGLIRQNMFISRDSRGVYRYHRLFREFLQKLPETRREEPRLLEKAGYWYLEQKDFYSAVSCFVRCESQKGIIKSFVFLAVIDRKSFIVDRLLPILHLPIVNATAERFPFIYSMMAWCAFSEGRPADLAVYADLYYERQFSVLRYDPRLAFFSVYMRIVDFRVTIDELKQLIRKVPRPILSAKLLGAKPTIAIINQYMPLIHRGTRDFSECVVPDVRRNVEELLGVIGSLFGDEAVLLAECVTAGLLFEQGDLSAAHRHALTAISEIRGHFAAETRYCAISLLVCILDALGERERANEYIAQIADMIVQDGAYVLSFNFNALKTRLELGRGDIASANDWLDKHARRSSEDLDFYGLYGHVTTCRAYIARGDYDSAVILLKRVLTLAQAYRRPLDVIEARVLLSIAYWKKKRGFQDEAIRHLEEAVLICYEYGYTQLIANEGAELAGMLQRLQKSAAQRKDERPLPISFIKMLYLKALENQKGGLTSGQPAPSVRFTQKQRTVMRLQCEGKTYKEIAESMGIQLSTLRSHIALIYKKLDVTREADAVMKIKSLGILSEE